MPETCTQKSKKGDMLNAHYDGYLAKDGSKFYCSRSDNKGHPKWFVLGVGQVIKGLDIGMDGMCVGEKRKVIIPPSLAFGEKGKVSVQIHTIIMNNCNLEQDIFEINLNLINYVIHIYINIIKAYFYASADSVPPNATVIFEIELYTVTRGPRSVESFREIDLDRDRSLSKSEVREYMKKEFETRGSKRDASFYDAIVADVFRKSDHNGDGLISAKEYNVYDHDEL
ncbi:FKBP7 isomerase, partial [Amia calva]|nr:FKBP7 isomerase [Amia calva]